MKRIASLLLVLSVTVLTACDKSEGVKTKEYDKNKIVTEWESVGKSSTLFKEINKDCDDDKNKGIKASDSKACVVLAGVIQQRNTNHLEKTISK